MPMKSQIGSVVNEQETTVKLLTDLAFHGKASAQSLADVNSITLIQANKLVRRTGLVKVQRKRSYGDNEYEWTPLGPLKELADDVEYTRQHELRQQVLRRVTNIVQPKADAMAAPSAAARVEVAALEH